MIGVNERRSVWEVETWVHATCGDEAIAKSVETRLRFVVYAGGDWAVMVRREDGPFDLLLVGQPDSRTSATLSEVFGFVFGRAA